MHKWSKYSLTSDTIGLYEEIYEDLFIFDGHAHIGRDKDGSRLGVDGLIKAMKESHVIISIVFPLNDPLYDRDFSKPNDTVLQAYKRYPKNLIPFFRLNPNFNWEDEFDRCLSLTKKHYLFMRRLRKKLKREVKVLNDPFIEDVCNDKYLTYLFLKRYVPTTVASIKEIGKIKSDFIVVKPRFGAGGRSVRIRKRNSVKALQKDFLLQEFVDTSSGVEGLVKGVHDLRLVILNGRTLDFYARKPRKGLISNISLGGRFVKVDRIPASAKRMGRYVDKKLRKFYPRLYSVDLLFDKNQRPWICELNAHPGLDVYHQVGKSLDRHEKLCKDIINSIICL